MRRALLALPAVLLLVAAAVAAGGRSAEAPRVLYMLHCQGCHLPDGAGAPGAVPAFAGSVGRFLRVPGGREYLVRVPGSSQSSLDDAELASVLNWIVATFGPAEVARDFAPFTPAEVASVRRPPLVDVESVRRELLGRLARMSAGASPAPGARAR